MQEQLLEKSDQLFRRYGIRSVSMDDIARELGISKKTLYQLVENKEELLVKVVAFRTCQEEEDMERLRAESTNALDALIRMGRYGAKMFSEVSPTFLYDLQKYYPQLWKSTDQQSNHLFMLQMRQNLERGMAEGLYRADLQPEIIARVFVHMITGLFLFENHQLTDPDLDLVQSFNQILLYHLYGIATDSGRDMINELLADEERIGGYLRPQS